MAVNVFTPARYSTKLYSFAYTLNRQTKLFRIGKSGEMGFLQTRINFSLNLQDMLTLQRKFPTSFKSLSRANCLPGLLGGVKFKMILPV